MDLRDQGVRIASRSHQTPSRTRPRSGHERRAAPCPCRTTSPTPSSVRSRARSTHPYPMGYVT